MLCLKKYNDIREMEIREKRQKFYNEYVLSNPYITEWEDKFFRDIVKHSKPLSDKQRKITHDIIENRIKKYIKLRGEQRNGYCKPATLRVARYK
jgi:hypothetical protein